MKLVAENSRIGLYVARMRSFQLLGPSSTIELVPVALETQQFFRLPQLSSRPASASSLARAE
jgi:hypothetical protein